MREMTRRCLFTRNSESFSFALTNDNSGLPGFCLVVSYRRVARGRLTGLKVHGKISY